MKQHKEILAINSLKKSEEALKVGFETLDMNLNVACVNNLK